MILSRSSPTGNRWCASISSSPLLNMVAESTLILAPIDQFGCLIAWAGVERLGQSDPLDFAARPRWPLDPAAEPVRGAVFLGIRENRHVWAVRVSLLAGTLSELRMLGGTLDDADAGLLTGAVAILNWHDSAGFSAIDGAPSEPTMSGWSRISTSTGHEEFPRTDPAVICLVHDGGDRVLLARQPTWPQRRFSILAGFVEAGESLETCVVREIKEEVGIDVHSVRYLGSQPWPFPRSVMLGFAAIGDPAAPLLFADGEIAEGTWFTKDEVRAALEHAADDVLVVAQQRGHLVEELTEALDLVLLLVGDRDAGLVEQEAHLVLLGQRRERPDLA